MPAARELEILGVFYALERHLERINRNFLKRTNTRDNSLLRSGTRCRAVIAAVFALSTNFQMRATIFIGDLGFWGTRLQIISRVDLAAFQLLERNNFSFAVGLVLRARALG